MTTDLHRNWYPIATSTDLAPRHVFQAKLLGREFAAWRADDGFVNLWENRCLHRGVRLSIGINDGKELKCQYHGWRYANRTAGCTYIPAHPADAPSRTICNNTYPVQESHGLIWAGEEAMGDLLPLEGFESATVLWSIPLVAPADLVAEALLDYGWDETCQGVSNADGSVTVTAKDGAALRIFVQPVDSDRSTLHGLYNKALDGSARIDLLRRHSWLMQEFRDRIEAEAATMETPAPLEPKLAFVSADLVGLPTLQTTRTSSLRQGNPHC